MLATAIRLYQRSAIVNRMVRTGVRVHHAIRKPETQPCPYAGECSKVGLAQAQLLGMAALPLIASRMSVCGPGADSGAPCLHAGVDRGEWCI